MPQQKETTKGWRSHAFVLFLGKLWDFWGSSVGFTGGRRIDRRRGQLLLPPKYLWLISLFGEGDEALFQGVPAVRPPGCRRRDFGGRAVMT
jgi:hypothetical protein